MSRVGCKLNCDVCDHPVAWADGVLCIDVREIDARTNTPMTPAERDYYECSLVQWGHSECIPEKGQYWIEGTRINTWRKAGVWMLHLSSKMWWKDVCSPFVQVAADLFGINEQTVQGT